MPIAACKAYYEPKHGSAKWANLASFSTATALFRFRKIHGAGAAAQMELPLPFAAGVREEPSRVIDTSCFIVCKHGRFRVLSVDDVHSKGLYYECLTDQVDPAVR
jgi:hypothetical protein